VLLTLPIRDVLPSTPRARIVRIDLQGQHFPYDPGQAVMIGAQGIERRRPYSIAGAPEDAASDGWLELLVGVDGWGRPGTDLILEPGALVEIEGPVGRFTFPPEPEEERFVFVAGGTGIAPLRSMLRHALHVPHRQIGLLYSARTSGEFAYESELRSLARDGRIELRQTVTRESAGEWTGTRGRISRGELAPLIHDPRTMCFVCGPPALVQDIPKQLEELGVAKQRIRVEEYFRS
jgi:ferredoxin-NADP reductase